MKTFRSLLAIIVLASVTSALAAQETTDASRGGDVAAGSEPGERETREAALADAERAFARSATDRDRDLFLSFLTPQTVFATPHGNLRGPDAILAQWAAFFAPDGPSIRWEPKLVAVVDDGSVGLTSGPFWIEAPDGAGGTRRFTGTFFSVWRPDEQGRWKIVLDTGTQAQPEE